MSLHLERSKEHLQRAAEDQARDNYQSARDHLLQAARCMLEAAQDADQPQAKAQRYAYANQFKDRADALLPRIEATQGSRSNLRRAAPETTAENAVSNWLLEERPNVRFSDVAGLEDVKQDIRLKLIYPFTHPDEARRFGVRSGGGILLYGPPGTGKTMIAKAVAGELDAAFFSVLPSNLMSKWVGEAEQNVASLFAAARRHTRAVIFVDEVEALTPRRRSVNSTVMQRVVPQILAELDGIAGKESALLFIGATNEPWMLDPAMMRPGRFDERIYVPLPDLQARQRILELSLRDLPLAPDVDLTAFAERLAGYSGADIVYICHRACEIPFLEAVTESIHRDVCLADLEQAAAEVRPSVDARELLKYEAFAGKN